MITPSMKPFLAFFDDAAVFPPGSAELADAVEEHLKRRTQAVEPMVGPLLMVPDRIGDAAAVANHVAGDLGIDLAQQPLRVSLVVAPGTAESIAPLVYEPPAGTEVSGLELKTDERWHEQLAAAIKLAGYLQCTVHVELSNHAVAAGGVAQLAGTPARLKFRTGGLSAELFPTVSELAAMIRAAAEARVPFKLTAGLHEAVRFTHAQTGFTHHGFLNIALAAQAAQGGAGQKDVEGLLADQRPDVFRRSAADRPGQWRSLFESFGTCSITEPIESLIRLGLLDPDLISNQLEISS